MKLLDGKVIVNNVSHHDCNHNAKGKNNASTNCFELHLQKPEVIIELLSARGI